MQASVRSALLTFDITPRIFDEHFCGYIPLKPHNSDDHRIGHPREERQIKRLENRVSRILKYSDAYAAFYVQKSETKQTKSDALHTHIYYLPTLKVLT